MNSQNSSSSAPGSETKKLRAIIDGWLTEILQDWEPHHVRGNKVIRDAVFGFNLFYQHEINIIDTPLLQRLRYIHQTALASLTYPTATHSRFEHSLGCTIIADRMMRVINEKHRVHPIENTQIAEVRLAALLHDCGHGPFSHASEFAYDDLSPELQNLRAEDMHRFGHAAGHEILSYLIVTSPSFQELWEQIRRGLYDSTKETPLCNLESINLERVGSMILGLPSEGCPGYLSQMINGPFDADKFDYIIRDGYFSGLTTNIDIGRLAVSLDLHREGRAEPVLCMDIGGATILEQMLFNKMVLFSSMYHHHKVRASFRQLIRLFSTIRERRMTIGGVHLSSAASFLRLDDHKVLSYAMQKPRLRDLAAGIYTRQLPKRALVIDRGTLLDISSRKKWVEFGADPDRISDLETEIASEAKVERADICVDFPPEPRIYKTAKASMIKLASGRPLVSLDSLYPIAGWMAGYEEYRFRSYVFCPNGFEKRVADATLQVLAGHCISIDSDLSMQQAKWYTGA